MASGGGNVEIELAVAGTPASSMISYVPHHLKVNFLGQTRIDELYNGYDFVRKNFSFDPGEVTENITFTFSSNDTEAPQLNDNNKVSYIDIRYPHSYNFPGTDAYDFYLKPGGGAKDLVEITGFGTTGEL
jgi:hypothetical protein